MKWNELTREEQVFIYRFVKEISFFLKQSGKDEYKAQFTLRLTADEREILLKFLDFDSVGKFG